MDSNFFALISRMRYIARWGLMRNALPENIQEHSHMVAVLAHALGVIRRDIFHEPCDVNALATAALYHDASEILTCSSVATIPANMEAAEDSGIPHEVADLVLPLGATMHMDGSCFSCVLKVAFLFGVFGLPFEGAGLFAEVLAVAVFSSVAMSGIPGGGYIAEFILCSLFFPDRMAVAYPIAVTIGNLVDPPATMVNAAGDYAASFLVARITEGSGWLERTDGERAA